MINLKKSIIIFFILFLFFLTKNLSYSANEIMLVHINLNEKSINGIPINPYLESDPNIAPFALGLIANDNYPNGTITYIESIKINIDKGDSKYIKNVMLSIDTENPFLDSTNSEDFKKIENIGYTINQKEIVISFPQKQIQIIQAKAKRFLAIVLQIDNDTPLKEEFVFTLEEVKLNTDKTLTPTVVNQLPMQSSTFICVDAVAPYPIDNPYIIYDSKKVCLSWSLPENIDDKWFDLKGIRIWRTPAGQGIATKFSTPEQESAILVYDSIFGPNNDNLNGFIDNYKIEDNEIYSYSIFTYDNTLKTSQTNEREVNSPVSDFFEEGITEDNFFKLKNKYINTH